MSNRLSGLCRPAILAAVVSLFAASLIASQPASAETTGPKARTSSAEVIRAISRERAVLAMNGNARINDLARGARPRARGDEAVTVATRSVGPEAAAATATAAAPVTMQLDMVTLDSLPRATGDAQWQCLASAIYHEARGEPLAGQIAVAEVVLNRVDSPNYPNTVCGVTTQGAGSGRGCQFSYACDGRSDAMTSLTARLRAEKLARMMLDGRPRTVTDGATHFHASYVAPSWSRTMARTASIGHHRFYRQGTRVAQR